MSSLSSVRAGLLLVASLAFIVGSAPDRAAADPQQILKSRDWTAYRHGEGRDRSCFAVTEQLETAGPARPSAHLMVTSWPQDGIKAEVSIKAAGPLRTVGGVRVAVDGTSFELFAADDRAFVADPREELRLIEAMRKGQQLTMDATLADGRLGKAAFSLRGFTQTVQAVTLCK